MRFAFTARDGWGQYPWGHQVFAGDVITYEQNWFVLAEGLSIGTRYFYPFALEASFQISPLIYCLAVDEHFLRNYTFVDILKWGVFLEPSVRAFFTIQHIELSLNFAYRHIGGLRGEAYIRRGDSDFFFSAGESGAGLSLIDASFLFKLRL
jgi:outer membrane protease